MAATKVCDCPRCRRRDAAELDAAIAELEAVYAASPDFGCVTCGGPVESALNRLGSTRCLSCRANGR